MGKEYVLLFIGLEWGVDGTSSCQSFHICQRTVAKGRVTKCPLRESLITTAFERVAITYMG